MSKEYNQNLFQEKLYSTDWDFKIANKVTKKVRYIRNKNIAISSSVALALITLSFFGINEYSSLDSNIAFREFLDYIFDYGIENELVYIF